MAGAQAIASRSKMSICGKSLMPYASIIDITWHWVRGHAGTEGNERADELARAGMAPFKAEVGNER